MMIEPAPALRWIKAIPHRGFGRRLGHRDGRAPKRS